MQPPPVPEPRKPIHPLVGAGVLAFGVGVLLWAWLGPWQWWLTGAVVMLVLGIAPWVRAGQG